jgi:NAD+ diphosphatase
MRVFRRLHPPAVAPGGPARWLLFRGADLLMPAGQPPMFLEGSAAAPDLLAVDESFLLGALDERPLLVGALADDAPDPAGLRPVGLRAVLAYGDAELAGLAGYAAQIFRWTRTSRFCGACATPLERHDGWGKLCPGCGNAIYPPVSPATITLVHDGGDRVLLGSKPGWGKRYSLLAGFVEPGESLEECVAREVREEAGVEVADLRYVGSQPWPFPHQLMVGFMARYAGGEIAVDTTELSDAAWFARDALPELPPPFSIARQIIEMWRSQLGGV